MAESTGRARLQDAVGVTFVNRVLGSGVCYGVVNLTLGTYNFMPSRDGQKVEPDLVVSCRLRLDIVAANELREALDKAIEMMMAAQAQVDEPAEPQRDAAPLN